MFLENIGFILLENHVSYSYKNNKLESLDNDNQSLAISPSFIIEEVKLKILNKETLKSTLLDFFLELKNK